MPAMELMAAMGLAGMEVFRYNRENFEFDQEQRFTKDEVRLKMQVELFNLFREDIRDLVELTTSKMHLYQFVGALFLKMICIFFCEGFFEAAVPPFLLSFYYVSQGCSAVYLLFAVWLSMHASVSSHSYSTRLLTRFVRLPIPGSEQINVLNARYADFEKQGRQMLRVPFLKDQNQWTERPQMESKPVGAEKGKATVAADYLGQGAFGYGGDQDMLGFEQELLKAVEFRTQRHIQLFRRLQAQWQCYDAYARVCMSLGIRMMLQGTSYYLLGLCWVQVNMPFVASVVAFVFQALALNIATLDIHGVNDLSVLGALPCFCGILALAVADRRLSGTLEPEQRYLLSLMMYPLEVLWFELLHWLASPMGDHGFLPRQFRQVLFMDVFSDLNEMGGLSTEERRHVDLRRDKVQEALNTARSALRKWEAVPRRWLTLSQYRLRKQVQKSYNASADALVDFMEKNHLPIPTEDDRTWEEYPPQMRREDPFSGTVLGPFNHWVSSGVTAKWYWDLENLYPRAQGGVLNERPSNARVLDLEAAMSVCKDFKRQVEGITHGFVDEHCSQSDSESDSSSFVGSENAQLIGRPKDRRQAEIEVNRLPWNLVSFITRALQMVWVGLGIIAALRETDAAVFDFQRSYIVEERRLQEELFFVPVEVSFPYRGFFQPQHLSCPSELMVSSPFAHYGLQAVQGSWELREKEELHPGRPLCSPLGCVSASQVGSELWLRNASEELRIGLPNATVFLAGSVLPCTARHAWIDEPWCLQLVLRSQERLLVEWTPLRSSSRSRLTEIALAQGEELAAVHLEQDQLWILFSRGRLERWHLSEGRQTYMALWESLSGDPFHASALSRCHGGIFILGRRPVSQRTELLFADA